MKIHHYDCECGWSGHWVTGGFRRKRTLLEDVEQQLEIAKNPRAKSSWRTLYQQILREDIAGGYSRTGMAVCFRCKINAEQLAVYNNGLAMHPLLCNTCGNEAVIYHKPESLPCPVCKTVLKAGPALTSEELLQRKLAHCKISFPNFIGGKVLMTVGTQAFDYLESIRQDIPFPIVTIEKGQGQHKLFIENVREVYLQTGFEARFEAELAIILAKHFVSRGIKVVSVIITPPQFEGRRRLEMVMEYIKEIQKLTTETIIVSGSALENHFGPAVEIYEKHIPTALRDILKTKG